MFTRQLLKKLLKTIPQSRMCNILFSFWGGGGDKILKIIQTCDVLICQLQKKITKGQKDKKFIEQCEHFCGHLRLRPPGKVIGGWTAQDFGFLAQVFNNQYDLFIVFLTKANPTRLNKNLGYIFFLNYFGVYSSDKNNSKERNLCPEARKLPSFKKCMCISMNVFNHGRIYIMSSLRLRLITHCDKSLKPTSFCRCLR